MAAFVLLALVHSAHTHGTLTSVSSNGQTACAVHTGGCTSTNGLKMREIIPRSGNTGICAEPPGCRASFECDQCGLEKVRTGEAIDANKWWTSMPAANWDQAISKPQFPCMSDDPFGTRGTMSVAAGSVLSTRIYVNADHSGLYQFQLTCGETASNAAFEANRITPWKALHKDKEGAALADDRVVGTTRTETDAYFRATTCTGANCAYRMNRDIQEAVSNHCSSSPADCFVEDQVVIPANFVCSGSAILRWLWNSAEGGEVYANCLDLTFGAATNPMAPPSPPTPPSNTGTGSTTNKGTCFEAESCIGTPTCCPLGMACFEKDEFWASCHADCTPGIHQDDAPQYQTAWSCTVLGGDVTTKANAPPTPPSPQGAPTPPSPQDTPTAAATAPSACQDESSFCKAWAADGECDINAAYMRQSCRPACGFCTMQSTAHRTSGCFWPVVWAFLAAMASIF